jgi:NADPH oxidase 2
MQVAWSIVFWTIVHIAAHMVNFTELAIESKTGVIGFIGANFLTGPGATGSFRFSPSLPYRG